MYTQFNVDNYGQSLMEHLHQQTILARMTFIQHSMPSVLWKGEGFPITLPGHQHLISMLISGQVDTLCTAQKVLLDSGSFPGGARI